MQKIKLLDLCCKAGGCSVGYHQAAQQLGIPIEITGVDIEPQPNYPYNFIQADAYQYLQDNHQHYTHIHASPPCQAWSVGTSMHKANNTYSTLMIQLTELIESLPIIAVIENVPTAPIRPDIVLQGNMFGLKVIRKRHFQLVNWFMLQPGIPPLRGTVNNGDYISIYGNASWSKSKNKTMLIPKWAKKTIRETWAFAMDINWHMTDRELSNAIPPAYTKYIGLEFFKIPNPIKKC